MRIDVKSLFSLLKASVFTARQHA